jgi:hypothetical protein
MTAGVFSKSLLGIFEGDAVCLWCSHMLTVQRETARQTRPFGELKTWIHESLYRLFYICRKTAYETKDARGNVTKRVEYVYGVAQETDYAYDDFDNKTSELLPGNGSPTRYEYNDTNNPPNPRLMTKQTGFCIFLRCKSKWA